MSGLSDLDSGERGSGISVLAARHHDDDDIYEDCIQLKSSTTYVRTCVCVCVPCVCVCVFYIHISLFLSNFYPMLNSLHLLWQNLKIVQFYTNCFEMFKGHKVCRRWLTYKFWKIRNGIKSTDTLYFTSVHYEESRGFNQNNIWRFIYIYIYIYKQKVRIDLDS